MTPAELCSTLDSTNLRLDATEGSIVHLCQEAARKSFKAVMVYPASVALCRKVLAGTSVRIGTVIGFPSGRFSTRAKAEEIRFVADQGSDEVDIVMNYSALMDGHRREVQAEIDELVALARRRGQLSKIIVETCFLDDARILESLEICETAGADFIKTSTGFGTKGATVHHIQMWRDKRRSGIKLKAAGGIKNLADARALIAAGAERLGTSNAASILAELTGEGGPAAGTGAY
jgi:deoxyribose-phosphate aldolase